MCSCIYWGAERLIIYNDAYGSILGTKHPWALGRTADEVWPEIFDVIGPLMIKTFETGTTTGADDAAIFLNRSGYVEEFYCSFSYAPLINELSDIEGVFAILPETSVRVIGERRLRTLQKLGADARELRRPEQTLQIAANVLSENPYDIPFAAMYMWDADGREANLCATSNIDRGLELSPELIRDDDDTDLARLARRSMEKDLEILTVDESYAPIPLGAWRIPAHELLILPFTPRGNAAPRAFMLAGVSPHKHLDPDHLAFFQMLADQISRSMSEAFSHEREDARARDLRERARVAQQEERVRIARDLHDTLLQSMQGIRYLLEAGVDRAKARDDSALKLFENALDASVHAVEEGRAVLSLLRSTAPTGNELSSSLSTLGTELVKGLDIGFSIEIRGEQRELQPQVWNDIYGICREAVANATRHSHGSTISVQLKYDADLQLSVVDDGCGMETEFAATGRPGHFGLQGMRERSENMGGHLVVESDQIHGTTILLSVPGTAAYAR